MFACGARLAANLTRTRWNLLYSPLQKALTRIRTNPEELRSISTEVRPWNDMHAGRCVWLMVRLHAQRSPRPP